MTDFLTKLCLTGAAVLFAAWLAITGGRWLARQLAAIRPYLAAFLVSTFVAMNYAQKSGTNEPPRGVSNGSVERVELVLPACSTRSTWLNTAAPFFLLESETTNETYSYVMPTNGKTIWARLTR